MDFTLIALLFIHNRSRAWDNCKEIEKIVECSTTAFHLCSEQRWKANTISIEIISWKLRILVPIDYWVVTHSCPASKNKLHNSHVFTKLSLQNWAPIQNSESDNIALWIKKLHIISYFNSYKWIKKGFKY